MILVWSRWAITENSHTRSGRLESEEPVNNWLLSKFGNQTGDISTLDGTSLKLVNKFTYRGSRVSSTEKHIDTRLTKAWTAIDRLSIIWKSDLIDKMKRSFFQAAVVSIQLYGCTTWTLTKRLEKLDGNYTRILRAILNKSWRQHPTRHQLYGHLPPITKTIQARRTRHAGHSWRSKDGFISDVLLWTPAYGQAKAGQPDRTYIQQYVSIRDVALKTCQRRWTWRERIRDIRAGGTTWWWWWWYSLWLPLDLQQFFFFIGYSYAHVSLLCFPLVTFPVHMLLVPHQRLAQAILPCVSR